MIAAFAASKHTCSFGTGIFDECANRCGAARVGERPHVRRRIKPVAGLQFMGALSKTLDERVINALLDIETRRGNANLPGIAELLRHHHVEGFFKIAIVKDEDRSMTAQFHRHPFHPVSRKLHEMLADRNGAGEADLSDHW